MERIICSVIAYSQEGLLELPFDAVLQHRLQQGASESIADCVPSGSYRRLGRCGEETTVKNQAANS